MLSPVMTPSTNSTIGFDLVEEVVISEVVTAVVKVVEVVVVSDVDNDVVAVVEGKVFRSPPEST